MDRLDSYRQIIKAVLKHYAEVQYAYDDIQNRPAFDDKADQFLIVSSGWGKTSDGFMVA